MATHGLLIYQHATLVPFNILAMQPSDQSLDKWHQERTWRRGVVAFRRWFHGKGQGGPQYFNPGKDVIPPASMPREQLLDRWEQHTKHCPSCKRVRSGTMPPLRPSADQCQQAVVHI